MPSRPPSWMRNPWDGPARGHREAAGRSLMEVRVREEPGPGRVEEREAAGQCRLSWLGVGGPGALWGCSSRGGLLSQGTEACETPQGLHRQFPQQAESCPVSENGDETNPTGTWK